MLTQKADLFASEMIHLNLHERPYFWIETSLQNLVQPPGAAAWCHIVSLFTQLPAYCSASIGRRYMCGARDHLYRAGPTQGRIHPVSSTLQLQVCALVLLFQLKVLVHLLKVSSRTSTSHQDVLHSGNAFSPKVSPRGQRVVMWRRAPWPEWKSLANLLFEELHKATVVPLLWAAHPWVHTVLWNTTITITIDTSTNSNIISLLHQHKLYHCSCALHSVLRTISTSAVLQMYRVHNLKQQDLTLLSWALCCDQRARTVSVSNERQKGGCCLPAAVSNCVFVWDGAAGGGVMNSYHT